MKRRKIRQRGYALVTAMAIGVVGLTITSVVMIRMMNSTSQITQREREDQATFMAESVANHVVDKIADITAELDADNDDSGKLGIYLTAQQITQRLHDSGQDFLESSVNNSGDIVFSVPASLPTGYATQKYDVSDTITVQPFLNSLNSDAEHSKIFWERFSADTANDNGSGSLFTLLSNSEKIDETLNTMHQNFYSIYHVEKGNQRADVRVSVVPLATDIEGTEDAKLHAEETFSDHHDVFKIQVTAFVPSIANSQTPKTLDIIVNRPVLAGKPGEIGPYSVQAEGAIDLGQQEASAGFAFGEIELDGDHGGDIHSNTSVTLGNNAKVRGKVTAVGKVNLPGGTLPDSDYPDTGAAGDLDRDSTAVTNRIFTGEDSGQANDFARNSRGGVEEIPIPEFKTDNLPTTACPTTIPNGTPVVFKDCVYTGDLSLTNQKTVVFEGSVHITGSLSTSGTTRCVSEKSCRVVVDKTFGSQGQGKTNDASSTNDMLLIVRNLDGASDCVDVGGTFGSKTGSGSYGALIYVPDEDCNTLLRGNAAMFGSVVTMGSVEAKGNGSSDVGFQRAINMSFPEHMPAKPIPKDELFPKVVSWKAKRAN